MYRKLEDFTTDWTYESESTLKVFNNLNDESLAKKVNENVRTAGRLAWHITTAIGEMAHRTGLVFKTVDSNTPVPATAKEIVQAYKEASENLLSAVKSNWNDDSLNVEDDMYGEMWKRGTTLGVIISHQIHHRAQLTIVMRLNGLTVPGIYGPSKEEWTQLGMPAQE
ncbi:MAG: DinB family protein [Ignavibacteriota bacterium]